MKLGSLLFVESRWNPDNLALFVRKYYGGAVLVLYDPTVSKLVAEPKGGIAAYVKLTSPGDVTGPCSGAWNVNYAVRVPAYPGAGQLLYALASDVVGAPITSDRHGSSSPEAKSLWRKIGQSPSFKRVELDNFAKKMDDTIEYYDINTDKETETPRPQGPKTPDPSDDCRLPGLSGPFLDKLGSSDAFRSSVSAASYLERDSLFRAGLTYPDEWSDQLVEDAKNLFWELYLG